MLVPVVLMHVQGDEGPSAKRVKIEGDDPLLPPLPGPGEEPTSNGQTHLPEQGLAMQAPDPQPPGTDMLVALASDVGYPEGGSLPPVSGLTNSALNTPGNGQFFWFSISICMKGKGKKGGEGRE